MTSMSTIPWISRRQVVFSWSFVLVFWCTFRGCVGFFLQPCGQPVEVEENRDFSFICDDYSGNVIWYHRQNNKSDEIGTCGPLLCTPNIGIPLGFFTLEYLTSGSSRLILTSNFTSRIQQLGGTYIRCGMSEQCRVDIVSHAVLTVNSLNFTTTQWMLNGRTDVISVYSSLGRYSCEWTESMLTSLIPGMSLILTPDMNNTSITQNRTGYCSFTKQLPSNSGTYNYTVVINPGNTERIGSFDIVLPEPPDVSCKPNGYVPEGSDVECTCSTRNVGMPKGRLVWLRVGHINISINAGNYGGSSLVMTPQNLKQADHNITTFRCDVDWIQNVSGQTYKALVGYGPSNVTFTPSSSILNETQTLSFDCKADGRPTPNIILIHRDSGDLLASQSSPLSWFVSSSRCEDGGVYSCSARNAMGADTQTDSNVYVKCQPREILVDSSSKERPAVNFKGVPVSLVFNMTAYPTPTSFHFTFIGTDMTSAISPELGVTVISLYASCEQRSRPLYITTCTLTVDNVTSATAAGFYRLTLTNDKGSGHFVFQVKVNATEDGSGAIGASAAAIAGGVVAVVIVVAVVVVVVVVVVITRRKQAQLNGPETDGGGEAGVTDEYAVVIKGNKGPAAASAQTSDTYAFVKKGKKTTLTGRTPDIKAKSSMPDTQKNKKLKHAATSNTDHGYSNITLSMMPPSNKADIISDDKHSKQTVQGGGRQTNEDGLTYTTVDFTGPAGQQSAQSASPPATHGVLYSEVVFNRATPTH